MAKYILTAKVTGKTVLMPGTPVELSEKQAEHPLWKNRVRKADGEAKLEVATPEAPKRGRQAKADGEAA